MAAALPWQLSALAGALAEAAPPIKFVAALFERATQIRDPDQLAFLACTTAFQRSVEKALKDFPDRPERPARALDVVSDIPGPDEGLRFATFSILEPWNHDFFRLAETLLEAALAAIGFGPDARRRILGEVRHRFGGELKSLIHHPKTRDRFLSFAESLRFPNVEERTRAAWNDHFDYQRYLFEDRPVFGEELFSLADTYVNTECGALTFRELQDGRARPRAEGPKAGEALTRPDPFNEQVGG